MSGTSKRTYDRAGSSLGYALLVGLIGVTALVAVSGTGDNVKNLFDEVAQTTGTVSSQDSAAAPTPDHMPDSFSFTSMADQPIGGQVISEMIAMTGFEDSLTFSISGDGAPQLRVNGGSWVSSASVVAGDQVELSLTASSSTGDMYTATYTVGEMSGTWDVTTTSIPDRWAEFDGSGDYLVYPTHGTYHNSAAGTMETWVWFNQPPTDWIYIIAKYQCGGADWNLFINTNYYTSHYTRTPYYWVSLQSPTVNWQTGQWYHIATTRGPAGMKLYLNGTEIASNSSTYGHVHYGGTPGFTLGGAVYACPVRYHNGRMDKVKIYLRQLSGAEVAQSYADGRAGSDTVDQTDLLQYYDFNTDFTNGAPGGGYNLSAQGDAHLSP
ncbi:MAG: hypothetical protein Alpg2KO_08310 [Alphaproteobacteria bacterium]